MYVATHDAVARVVSLALSKHPPRPPKLWYLEGARQAGLTGDDLWSAVDRVAMQFPGRVRDVAAT